MRVLFSSTWGYGHIFPMLPLARAFRDAGHDVLWATSAEATRHVAAAGLDAAPAGAAGPEFFKALGRLHAIAATIAPPERAAFMYPSMFGELLTPPMVADLLPLARDWQPDLMIHEHGELASPLVGAVLGTPSVTHSFGGAIPGEMVAAAAEKIAPLWTAHGQDPAPYAGCFTSLYLDICPSSVQSVAMDHIRSVQPLRPVSRGADRSPDDGPPLVYLTLGTVQNHAPILPVVVAALAALPVRLLVAVGPDGDPGALGELPDNVHVEKWVDQPEVLERSDVVVSHAGSGTFLGALAAGRPQLCLPLAADQFRNAAGGSRSGTALVLGPGEVSAESVTQAMSRLLSDESFRDRAREVSAEIARMPSPAEVVDVLVEHFGRT
ncbi:glycosyltransferase [Nocardioides sp.]|uniref:glycosyltransferase n=1 Tax=Nocardioides sp. TaxID=35761 RepID=UPI00286D8B7B|nr:glycosyltransferase [Nocardioides sp.]